jgi:hypothetical protein
MQNLNKLIGKYYFIEQGTDNFSTEFLLDIFEEDIKICFILKMVVNGNFGEIGRNWVGICVDRDEYIALIAEKEIDWTHTVIDNKRAENEKNIFEILPLEVYSENSEIILNIVTVSRKIILLKSQS